MRHQIISLFLILFAISPALMANTQTNDVWNLERCIAHALENNLDVRIQRLHQAKADHDLTQSYTYLLPGINANTNFGLNYGRSIDQVTNEIYTERIGSQSLSASGNLTLFAGFRTINNIRYNLARQTAFRHNTESMENDLILTIANAYLQILYLEDMLEVAAEQLNLSREQTERTRILLEGGTVSRRDLLEMEAVEAEEQVRHTNIQNNLNLAYLELINLLELDPSDPFTVQRPNINVSEFRFFYDPTEVFEKALLIEPSLQASKYRISMAEKGLAIANGERMPTISLNTSLGSRYSEAYKLPVNQNGNSKTLTYRNASNLTTTKSDNTTSPIMETVPYSDQLTENYARSAFITVNIPILNQFQARTRIQHARIDLDQARMNYEQTRNNLSKIIHQAHADALAAYEGYNSNSKALEASRASYNYAEQGYTLGRVSTLELNEAKARLNRAETNLIQSMYEFVFKVKILEFYQGEGFVL